MTPNIDRKGRIARAVSGLLCLGAAGAVIWTGWPAPMLYRWGIGGACVLAGAFQLFEAKRGWCIARACGLKTPM